MSLGEAVDQVLRTLERARRSGGDTWGIPTGFPSLDRVTGGLHQEELTVLAARPGIGKTSFALQVITTNLFNDKRVAFYETEMTTSQLVTRVASQLSGVSSWKVFRGLVGPELESRWIEALQGVPRLFSRCLLEAGRTWEVDELVAHCLAQHRVEPFDLIVVDHLNRLLAGTRVDSYARAAYCAVRLKELANLAGVPVLVLSQLNRRTERDDSIERPSLGDLRESGRIEEEADNVWFLWRQRRSGLTEQIAELSIEKSRNGPVTTVELGFRPETTQFVELRR